MLRHSIASIVALALFGLSRLIYSIVISRRFGVEVLGKVNSLISQAFLLAVPLSFFAVALGKYASEFLGRGEMEKIKSIATLGFSFPLAGLVLVPFNFYLAILAVLRALQLTFRSFIYGLHKGEVYAYTMIGAFVLFIGGFLSENYYLPYIGLLSGVAIFGFLYLFRERLFGKPSLETLKPLLRYSSFAFLGTVSGVFLIQAPYFLTEKLASPEAAGIVSASLSAAFLLTYLPQVLQSAIMPLYSYKYGKNEMEYVKRLAEDSTKLLSFIVALAVFILMLVGREILSLLFGFNLGREFYLTLMAVETYIAYNPQHSGAELDKICKRRDHNFTPGRCGFSRCLDILDKPFWRIWGCFRALSGISNDTNWHISCGKQEAGSFAHFLYSICCSSFTAVHCISLKNSPVISFCGIRWNIQKRNKKGVRAV
ncbi:hypothetical protein OCC_05941 [Thermococcus litoralis DSM 5473]|uniref:Lipopolysaccharide biosynthesis protein n=2 Tax=Thermococcus litoralis TaxID=2265 RepID=H3ZMY4_THELN|nr:hypothetical protein OCC_05941 [Thermococcus litoralis DSM 5473]